jgi:hypothetical protein
MGNKAIDTNFMDPSDRFGKGFYLAEDTVTAVAETNGTAQLILTFSLDASSNILDLTNLDIATKLGYNTGMSRDEVHSLMKDWNLNGVDAIRFPSEKNQGDKLCSF